MERLEAVVIGAGHAGLAASRCLAAAGIDHAVLERGRIGETWRSQRWDSFALNTPSWMNRLPGDTDADVMQPADAFPPAPAFAERLAAYAARWRLPVREGTPVTALVADDPGGDEGSGRLRVEIGGPGGDRVSARSVVLASGIQNVPQVPSVAVGLPRWVAQVPSLAYRRPGLLPDGAVLVIGGGQTGGQIVEDLLDAGTRVYLSPSRVPRAPRRYRGRDVFEWLVPSGFLDVTPDRLPDPSLLQLRQPLISGVGRHGHSVSLQWLASRGATLVGRIRTVEGDRLLLDDTIGACIRFGDTWSATMRRLMDDYMDAAGISPPPLEDDPADDPHPEPDAVHSPASLDLRALDIRTVIWATGVRGAFEWLPDGALGADGSPAHRGGVTGSPGLFVLGLPWLTCRGSGIIHGAAGDAQRIADRVVARAS